MPLIVPYIIKPSFIQSHRDYYFLYGMDYMMRGAFSQAVAAHGEPNCFPIPTLYKYCANPVYWNDNEFSINCIDEFMNRIPLDKPIIPFRKIGMGCSRLHELAPKAFAHMISRIDRIASKDYEIDYKNIYAY